jgi:hypothetical protein
VRRLASAGAAVLVAAALGACGSSSDDPQTSIDTGTQPARSAAGGQFAQLRACLRQNGVEVPQGRPRSDRRTMLSDPAFQRAMQACRQYLPQGGPPPGAAG